MTRTMDGIINFWNQSAEKLYGWRKEEAIGKVSHSLLQTQFPKPLKEIESELVEKGRWEGKLVHATRDGGHVVVESRWILDPSRQPGAVIEINVRSTDDRNVPSPDGHVGETTRQESSPIDKLAETSRRSPKFAGILLYSSLYLVACLTGVWILYFLVGHRIIDWVYTTESLEIIDQWLEGKRFTPLSNYYQAADALLVYGTLKLLAVYGLLILLIRKPSAVFFIGFSVFVSSLALFSLVEVFPSLIRPLRLSEVSPYHAYKADYLYDEELGYKERPFNRIKIDNYKGGHYSPLYGVDVPPEVVEWETDEHGFRNSRSMDSADIVAVGDSYFEWGPSAAETFVGRLENQLTGLRVMNLSKSGYGPFQYLAVLKRFGAQYKPKYALFGFYEGNDIANISDFLLWKSGSTEHNDIFLRFSQLSFLGRYWAAMEAAATWIKGLSSFPIDLILDRAARRGGYAHEVHPDLALLKFGERADERLLFVERLNTIDSTEEMLKKEEWRAFEKILLEFKAFCAEHGIVPIIVYVPTPAHIYAQFSTDASGQNWLESRDGQIAAKENTVNAVRRLTQKLGIALIDLSPRFELAAKEGKILYYPLDPHWNLEGRELAARFVADTLKASYLSNR